MRSSWCRESTPKPFPNNASSGFLFLDFQIEHNLLLAVEAGDSMRRGFRPVFFRMNFVVRVGVEAAEAVVPFVVGYVAANRIGARVLKEDHARRNWILGRFVDNHAAHGTQLGLALGVLRSSQRNAESQRHTQRQSTTDVHLFPPAAGCN